MKIIIDHDLCIGCGACQAEAPKLIDMNDDQLAEVIVGVIEDDAIEDAKRAIEACPVDAISEETDEEEE